MVRIASSPILQMDHCHPSNEWYEAHKVDAGVLGGHAVGRRLALVVKETDPPSCHQTGLIVSYHPKTTKHRILLDDAAAFCDGRSYKNVILDKQHFYWLSSSHASTDPSRQSQHTTHSLELAIQHDAQGRRLQVQLDTSKKNWHRAVVLHYVEDLQQHVIQLAHNGKVQLVDLAVQQWKYIDLIGPLLGRNPQWLATSKYMGVTRVAERAWCAHYQTPVSSVAVRRKRTTPSMSTTTSTIISVGCFSSEKDAALAYDLYARRDDGPVNFEDRLICKAVLEHLKIDDPTAPKSLEEQELATTTTATATATATARENQAAATRSKSVSTTNDDDDHNIHHPLLQSQSQRKTSESEPDSASCPTAVTPTLLEEEDSLMSTSMDSSSSSSLMPVVEEHPLSHPKDKHDNKEQEMPQQASDGNTECQNECCVNATAIVQGTATDEEPCALTSGVKTSAPAATDNDDADEGGNVVGEIQDAPTTSSAQEVPALELERPSKPSACSAAENTSATPTCDEVLQDEQYSPPAVQDTTCDTATTNYDKDVEMELPVEESLDATNTLHDKRKRKSPTTVCVTATQNSAETTNAENNVETETAAETKLRVSITEQEIDPTTDNTSTYRKVNADSTAPVDDEIAVENTVSFRENAKASTMDDVKVHAARPILATEQGENGNPTNATADTDADVEQVASTGVVAKANQALDDSVMNDGDCEIAGNDSSSVAESTKNNTIASAAETNNNHDDTKMMDASDINEEDGTKKNPAPTATNVEPAKATRDDGEDEKEDNDEAKSPTIPVDKNGYENLFDFWEEETDLEDSDESEAYYDDDDEGDDEEDEEKDFNDMIGIVSDHSDLAAKTTGTNRKARKKGKLVRRFTDKTKKKTPSPKVNGMSARRKTRNSVKSQSKSRRKTRTTPPSYVDEDSTCTTPEDDLVSSSDEWEKPIDAAPNKTKRQTCLSTVGRKSTAQAEPTVTKPKLKKFEPKSKGKKSSVRDPKYPVGTRFIKEFPDYGTFEGRVTAYDGKHYQVYYSADEDEEELSEYEFEEFEILSSSTSYNGGRTNSAKAETGDKKVGRLKRRARSSGDRKRNKIPRRFSG